MTNTDPRPATTLPMPQASPGSHGNRAQSGKIGWAVLWFLGIPLPILLILYAIMA